MKINSSISSSLKVISAAISVVILSSCGGGGGGTPPPTDKKDCRLNELGLGFSHSCTGNNCTYWLDTVKTTSYQCNDKQYKLQVSNNETSNWKDPGWTCQVLNSIFSCTGSNKYGPIPKVSSLYLRDAEDNSDTVTISIVDSNNMDNLNKTASLKLKKTAAYY